MNTFSGSACIRFGWETFKKRPWFFIGVFLFVGLLSSGGNFQLNDTDYSAATIALFIVAGIAFGIISILAKMGATQLALKAHDSAESATFGDLRAPHPFWKFIGASFVVAIIVGVGLI